jgi:hypothetical protein
MNVLLWFGTAEAMVVPVHVQGNKRFAQFDGATLELIDGGNVKIIDAPDDAEIPITWCGK